MKRIILVSTLFLLSALILSGCRWFYYAYKNETDEQKESVVFKTEDKEYIPSAKESVFYVTNCPQTADMYDGVGADAKVIASIPYGSEVVLLGVAEKGHYFVRYQDMEGYMPSGNLAEEKPEPFEEIQIIEENTKSIAPAETPKPPAKQQKPPAKQQKPPAGVAGYTDAEIKKMVAEIRELYVKTQSELKSYKCDGFRYYDSQGLVHVDIRAGGFDGFVDNSYNREYYYKNGRLKFAFIYKNGLENRFYFENGKMFRWKDENGVIHDQATNNNEYLKWEKDILKESEKASL